MRETSVRSPEESSPAESPSPRASAGGRSNGSGVSRWFRRGPWEIAATLLIGAGVLMLLQPFAIALYTYSFVTTLAGVLLFTIVSKFPE